MAIVTLSFCDKKGNIRDEKWDRKKGLTIVTILFFKKLENLRK